MSIEILSTGPMLTVQDAGRLGARHLGVSAAGPIDAASMALANVLVGNGIGEAALEFAGPAGRFRTTEPVRFAVMGANSTLRIDQRPVSSGESHLLNPGETLTVGAPSGAVWAYLAFSGGIRTPEVLGSRATHLRSGLGGRALRQDDILPLASEAEAFAPCFRLPPGGETFGFDKENAPIRIILGPQDDYFSPEILSRLTDSAFLVTPQRDRMAMVLGGTELPAARGHDIVSDGTVPGSIQVPGSGHPLVLLAESQTTGGYPKIGTIASADLARLAQMPVGASFRFAIVSRDAAEEIWIARQQRLRKLLAGLVAKPHNIFHSDYLLSCDLVGGIYAPEEITRPTTQFETEPQS